MILGKTGICKDVTGNNCTNGKVNKNGALMLNFPKLKLQTLHPKPSSFGPQTPTS